MFVSIAKLPHVANELAAGRGNTLAAVSHGKGVA